MRRSEHSSGRSLGLGIDDFSPGDTLGMEFGLKRADITPLALSLALNFWKWSTGKIVAGNHGAMKNFRNKSRHDMSTRRSYVSPRQGGPRRKDMRPIRLHYQVSPSCLSLQGKALHIRGNQLKSGRSTQEQELPGLCVRTIFDQHFVGLMGAAFLGYCERNPAEVEGLRLSSNFPTSSGLVHATQLYVIERGARQIGLKVARLSSDPSPTL